MPLHTRDFLGYLFDQYTADPSQAGPTLGHFLSFCRNYLRQYPPVRVDYLGVGLGVTLSNNVSLAFTPDQLGTHVTKDETFSVMGGLRSPVSTLPSADAVNIFTSPEEPTQNSKEFEAKVDAPADKQAELPTSEEAGESENKEERQSHKRRPRTSR